MPALHAEVPVLIVGAGPAGMATSILLSRSGIRSLLVEKHPDTAHLPRAHIINQRTVEIFRHMGIEDRVLAAATPHHLMANNVWHTSLAGLEIARLRAWGADPSRASEYARTSPSPMANCPQTVLEPILRASAEQYPQGELRFAHEFLGARQSAEDVTVTLLNRGTGEEYEVRAQYLVGADGGRSRVLESAGLHVDGEAGLATAMNVWMDGGRPRALPRASPWGAVLERAPGYGLHHRRRHVDLL